MRARRILRFWVRIHCALVLALVLGSCARHERPLAESKPLPLSVAEIEALHYALVTYADIGWATYDDAARGVRALEATVDRLLLNPSADGLAEARKSWIAARRPYQQSEAFRFYDGPIDRVEMLINTWPIDESYVEAGLQNKPGIIENTTQYPELSTQLLVGLNAKQGETSISTGYHVVEYLLWGRDTRADGPGDRPYTDFVSATSPVAARRGQYLRLSLGLLARQLEDLESEWDKNGVNNYRKKFLDLPPLSALALVIKGLGSLSGPELAGERLTVAYETKDQENEHSCFSDNTVSDLADDALGIQNVALGRYVRSDGSSVKGRGIDAVIAIRSPELAQRLEQEIGASAAAVRAIPVPFDQSILGSDTTPGRKAIAAAIAALEKQVQTLTEVSTLYDLRSPPVKTSL